MKSICPYCGRTGEIGTACDGCGYLFKVTDQSLNPGPTPPKPESPSSSAAYRDNSASRDASRKTKSESPVIDKAQWYVSIVLLGIGIIMLLVGTMMLIDGVHLKMMYCIYSMSIVFFAGYTILSRKSCGRPAGKLPVVILTVYLSLASLLGLSS